MSDPLDSTFLRRGLKWSGWTFLIALVLAVLDAMEWLVWPQPFRIAIPVALVLSSLTGITLLVGILGTPKRKSNDKGQME